MDLPTSGFYCWSGPQLDFSIEGSSEFGVDVVEGSGIRGLEAYGTWIFNM